MAEYAVLSPSGSVINIVSSSKTLAAIQSGWKERVVPIETVPIGRLTEYEYWDKRP